MLKYFREILHLLGGDRRKLPALIVLFLGSSLLDLAGIGLIGPYIALVMDSGALDGLLGQVVEFAGLPREQEALLKLLGLILLVVFLLKAIAGIWINYKITRFGWDQQVRLRSFLMQSYQTMQYSEYLRRNSSEYIYSIEALTGQFAIIVFMLLRTLSDGIVSLMILGLLVWQDAPALLLMIGLLGAMVIIYDRLFRQNIRVSGQKANVAATSMIQGIHEGIEGLKEIRVLGVGDYFHQVVRRGAAEFAVYQTRAQVFSAAPRFLLELLMISFVVLLTVGMLFFEQSLQDLIPTLGMFGVAALRLLPSVNSLSSSLMQIRYSRDSISRLYGDLMQIEQMERKDLSESYDSNHGPFQELKLDRIDFCYSEGSRKALSQISLEIHAGESIGLIGSSGSGKTTLVDVILGFLEPQEGVLNYNGKPMNSVLAEWRSQVAYLPQQVFLIDNTVRHNVALGVNSDEIDNLKVCEALRLAKLEKFVAELPEGVHTMLGERGVRISGGQRQRIALARAFYHGRSVLVMDEATSSLDIETEQEIVDEIKQLKGEKTMIVIAHRLTTLQHCDRIYELKDGQVFNTGSYQKIISSRSKGD